MSRPKIAANADLPPYLSFDKNTRHFRYRHPQSKKTYAFGRDRLEAIASAIELNGQLMKGTNLVALVLGQEKTMTLSEFIDKRFMKILSQQELAKNTLKSYTNILIEIKKKLGHFTLETITIRHIADFLAEKKATQSNQIRSLLSVIFKHAIAQGLTTVNHAANTLKQRVVKQRQRLKEPEFEAILAVAPPWLQRAMLIALLTSQRREDICYMQYTDIKEGYLYVVQRKTKKHGKAAYLKMHIGSNLQAVIDLSRDGVDSPYIVHHKPFSLKLTENFPDPTFVSPDLLSRAFSEARDSTHLFDHLSARERPTFHEIRSLAIHSYSQAGKDAQKLAGHTNAKMTEAYKKGHEEEWTSVQADLQVDYLKNYLQDERKSA